MNTFWVFCLILVRYGSCVPAETFQGGKKLYVVEYKNDATKQCDGKESFNWSNDFHHCFMDRKYKDSGRDLESIVERILNHSEECIQTSRKNCRPDLQGLQVILNMTIVQIKDYSMTYLENIYNGREKIKDLECVEKVLSLPKYTKCFETVLVNPIGSEEKFRKGANDAVTCMVGEHKGCSPEAKASMNRIVRNILGVEQPREKEDLEDEIVPTPEPPMRWYDYIAQPFISAWNFIRSLFG